MIIGRAVKTVPAMIWASLEVFFIWSWASPTGRVNNFSLFITMRGQRKSFQRSMKVRMTRVAIPGMASGSAIL